MSSVKERMIQEANKFIKEGLTEERLKALMNEIDLDKLKLTDLELTKVETHHNSSVYNNYKVVRHTFEHEQEVMEVDIEHCNDFGDVFPSDFYKIFYDTFNGTEVELYNVDKKMDHFLAELLNTIDYAHDFVESIYKSQEFEKEEIETKIQYRELPTT